MDELVNSLFSRLELMVLGAAALALGAYFLATAHPIKRTLIDYYTRLARFWSLRFGDTPGDKLLATVIKAALVIVALFYCGVLANAASYWAIEPVRFRILDCIYVETENCTGAQASEVDLTEALLLPWTRPETEGAGNAQYLADEVTLGRRNNEHVTSILDGELNFIRILRGTVLLCLCAALLSAFKFAFVLVSSPIWLSWGPAYTALIDESEQWREKRFERRRQESETSARFAVAAWRVLLPQALILVASLTLYWAAMGSYRVAEFEYSRLVAFAAADVRKHPPREAAAETDPQ